MPYKAFRGLIRPLRALKQARSHRQKCIVFSAKKITSESIRNFAKQIRIVNAEIFKFVQSRFFLLPVKVLAGTKRLPDTGTKRLPEAEADLETGPYKALKGVLKAF